MIQPLFAHWRQPPPRAVTPNASDAGGGEGGARGIFCAFDDEMEATLQRLHARQRTHGDVQAEIDTWLVACIALDLRQLVLPRNHVPHYDNLPDISGYAIGILDPSMDLDPELQQVLLLLRQCTPLRRRTKRAQREVHARAARVRWSRRLSLTLSHTQVQWREESLVPMQTLVRCLQVRGVTSNSRRRRSRSRGACAAGYASKAVCRRVRPSAS